jgi:hypothetical protein
MRDSIRVARWPVFDRHGRFFNIKASCRFFLWHAGFFPVKLARTKYYISGGRRKEFDSWFLNNHKFWLILFCPPTRYIIWGEKV